MPKFLFIMAVEVVVSFSFFTPSCFATQASVDHIRMTIYYTDSGGGGGGGSGVPALSFTSGGIALAGFLWSRHRSKKNRGK